MQCDGMACVLYKFIIKTPLLLILKMLVDHPVAEKEATGHMV